MAKTNRKLYRVNKQTGTPTMEQNNQTEQMENAGDEQVIVAIEDTVEVEQVVQEPIVNESPSEEVDITEEPVKEVVEAQSDFDAQNLPVVTVDEEELQHTENSDIVEEPAQEETPTVQEEGLTTPTFMVDEATYQPPVKNVAESVLTDAVITQEVSPAIVPEIKPLIEINIADTEPTQEDTVRAFQTAAVTTPVNTEGLVPSVRAQTIQGTDSLIRLATTGADTVVISVLENLRTFVNEMDPLKPMDERKAGNLHVNLYRSLKGGIEHVETDFNVFFGTILAVFKEHAGTVFHEKYLLRGYMSANFAGGEANRYVTLLQTFKTLADPETRVMNVKQVNFTKAFEGFNERAQQKLRAFFNV